MGEIEKVQKQRLLKESKKTRKNIENICMARPTAINFLDEIASRASEARRHVRQAASGLKT